MRTQVVVHDIKPPFLDGRTVYSKQSEPVMPVKDPTSDMAVVSSRAQAYNPAGRAGGVRGAGGPAPPKSFS